MIKAFVFGKFMPFHKGHEAMINFALKKCNFLTVIICASNQEKISGEVRKQWLKDNYKGTNNVKIKVFEYREEEYPNTSESSIEVSKVWAQVFKTLVPESSLLITSEPYGEYVTHFMQIEHLMFDEKRIIEPISATIIRKNLSENWKYLPESVKPFFSLKVVILGTESTGKTTLVNDLAKFFQASLVLEAGREIIENSNNCTFKDLEIVSKEHAKKIKTAIISDNQLVIIDTDVNVTKSYARFMFQKELKVTDDILNINKANLYLFLQNDVPYFQDGTRLEENERNLLDQSHRKVLSENKIDFIEISGTWDERFQKSKQLILNLINKSDFF